MFVVQLFLDVEEEKRARWEHITRFSIAGRGAFGTVLAASWRPGGAGGGGGAPVALKALQPVPPPPGSDMQAQHTYKVAFDIINRLCLSSKQVRLDGAFRNGICLYDHIEMIIRRFHWPHEACVITPTFSYNYLINKEQNCII